MLKKRNIDIREVKGNLPAWLIAEKLGIHEKTFYSWLRFEMSNEKKKSVIKAINEVRSEMREQQWKEKDEDEKGV